MLRSQRNVQVHVTLSNSTALILSLALLPASPTDALRHHDLKRKRGPEWTILSDPALLRTSTNQESGGCTAVYSI